MPASQMSKVLLYLRSIRSAKENLSDSQLLDRYLKDRDESAFETLVRRHGSMVLGLCRRILKNGHDAEDAFQATFLVLVRKAGSIRNRESVGGFLYGVAYKTALKARSVKDRRREKERQAGQMPQRESLEEDINHERLTLLDQELSRLPDKYRVPIVLCDLEGKSRKAAAKQLGWREGTLSGRLARARALLAKRLSRRGLALPAGLAALGLSSDGASACVPPSLMASTVKAAGYLVTGQATVAGLIPAKVAALMDAVLKSMLLSKLKIATAILLLTGLLGGGGLLVPIALSELPAERPSNPKAEEKAQPRPQMEKQQARTDRYGDPLPPGAIARLGTVQRRFDAQGLAWTDDGRTILACNRNRSFRWWEACTGTLKKSQDWPGPAWRRVHLSPNGNSVAAEEMSGQLTLWDVATGRRLHSYDGYRWIGDYPFAFSPDSRVLTVAKNEGMAGILHHIDIATGERRTIGKHLGVCCLAVSPDNKRLFSGGGDGSVRCWDIATAREVWKVENWNSAMALSPDGRTLAVNAEAARQTAIRYLDAATGRTRSMDKPIKAFCLPSWRFSPQGDVLLVGVENRDDVAIRATIWDLGTEKERFQLPAYTVCFSPDGKTVAGFQGFTLQCWDLLTGKPLFPDTTRMGHTQTASALTYSSDGKILASVGYDCTIRLWDVANSRLLHTFRDRSYYYPAFVRFTSDGKLIAGLHGASLRIWDIAEGKEVRRLMLRGPGPIGSLEKVHLSLDSKTLSTLSSLHLGRTPFDGEWARTLIRWDVATGKPLFPPTRLPPHRPLDFSADGRVFLIDEKDIHETPNADVHLAYPAGHYLALMSPELGLAFSPDGALAAAPLRIDVTEGKQFKQLAAGIQVWELATGQAVARLPAKDFAHLAFSPDGRTLAAAGPNDLRVWEIATAKELYRQTVPGHLLNVYGSPLVFAPDGRTLATALEDTTIAIWDVSTIHRGVTARSVLSAKQQDSLWADLAGKDASKAYAAIAELTARPEQTVSLLRQRLQPVAPLSGEILQSSIAELDSPDFRTREAALQRLTGMRPLADAALRAALTKKPSLEMRKRIEALLSARVAVALSPETLRGLRAVRVLEQAATPEARRLLRELAMGAEGARLTEEAKAALRRFTKSGGN